MTEYKPLSLNNAAEAIRTLIDVIAVAKEVEVSTLLAGLTPEEYLAKHDLSADPENEIAAPLASVAAPLM